MSLMRGAFVLVGLLLVGFALGENGTAQITTKGYLAPEFAPTRAMMGAWVSIYKSTAIMSGWGKDSFSGSVNVYRLVKGQWLLNQVLTPIDPKTGDHFGWGCEVWENTLVVGAVYKRFDGEKRGAAYIFERPAAWQKFAQVKELTGEPQKFDNFGYAVQTNSEFVFVGAEQGPTEEDALSRAGKVYVYIKQDEEWTHVQTLVGEGDLDQFGDDIRLSNTGDIRLVIGAPFAESEFTADGSGAAYVYTLNEERLWTLEQKLTPPPEESEFGDNYGTATQISDDGQLIVVGADRGASDNGAAYIYEYMVDNWVLVQTLTALSGNRNDRFGYKFALGLDFLAVGAYGVNANGENDAGGVYLFRKDAFGIWRQSEKYINWNGRERDGFGTSLATNNKWLLIGEVRYDGDGELGSSADTGLNDGRAHVYKINSKPKYFLALLPEIETIPTTGTVHVNYRVRAFRPEKRLLTLSLTPLEGTNPILTLEHFMPTEQFDGTFNVDVAGLVADDVYVMKLELSNLTRTFVFRETTLRVKVTN